MFTNSANFSLKSCGHYLLGNIFALKPFFYMENRHFPITVSCYLLLLFKITIFIYYFRTYNVKGFHS